MTMNAQHPGRVAEELPLESKFSALIQPIKDLAANWDIDIADSLTNYLDELDSLRISVDGEKGELNFAEAALLIQGSAAVYSKKVEYLYQLVTQALEFITNKKSTVLTSNGREKSSAHGDTGASFEEECLSFEDDPKFLLLDNLIAKGENIDLSSSLVSGSASSSSAALASRSRLSGEHAPSASLQQEDVSRLSMAWNTSMLADSRAGNMLRLSSSFMDKSGALLIGAQQPPLDMNGKTTALDSFYQSTGVAVDDIGADDDDGGDMGEQAFDADINGAVAFDVADGLGSAALEDPAGGQVLLLATQSKSLVPAPVPRAPASAPAPDLMDPHMVVSGSRPVRRGRPFRIPSALKATTTMANKEEPKHVDVFWENSVSGNGFWRALSDCLPASSAVRKTLFNPFLIPVYSVYKSHARKGREQSKKQANYPGVLDSSVDNDYANDYAGFRYAEEAVDDDHHFSDGVGDDDFDNDINCQALPEFFPSELANSISGENVNIDAERGDGDGDMGMFRDEEEELARRLEKVLASELTESSSDKLSYAAILKAHMDKFTEGAQEYARENQLSRRVSDWTQRLEPILKQQEDSKPFDIHTYSDELLGDLQEATETSSIHGRPIVRRQSTCSQLTSQEMRDVVNFGEIVQGQSPAEVCRTFLACLQLANLGNVVIDPDGERAPGAASAGPTPSCAQSAVEALKDDFSVMLITASQEILENYRAPSLHTLAATTNTLAAPEQEQEQQENCDPATMPTQKKTSAIRENKHMGVARKKKGLQLHDPNAVAWENETNASSI